MKKRKKNRKKKKKIRNIKRSIIHIHQRNLDQDPVLDHYQKKENQRKMRRVIKMIHLHQVIRRNQRRSKRTFLLRMDIRSFLLFFLIKRTLN